MAPDINTLPTSPRPLQSMPVQTPSTTTSRRTSQIMPPPAVPYHPTHQQQQHHRSPILSASSDASGVPLRHPRPLTAAELYLECEKEQEAVVNRLTRELTALRAQTASVASNASHSSTSTSASLLPIDISDPNPTHQMTGATHPTPSRRHRSSSSLSTRSIPTPSTSVSAAGSSIITNSSTQAQPAGSTTGSTNIPHSGISQASADRAAAVSTTRSGTAPLSRQPSITTPTSGTSTPARQSMDLPRHYSHHHRPPLSRDASYASQTPSSTIAQPGTPLPPPQSPSQSVNSALQHYADTTAYRTEMEIVKAENEALRQRVRALEGALRARRRDSSQHDHTSMEREREVLENAGSSNRGSGGGGTASGTFSSATAAWAAGDGGVGGVAGPRERSESQSTTASSRRGVTIGGGAVDDEVRVGESASSSVVLGPSRGG